MPGKLTRAELEELLAQPEVAVLCTVDGEGRPEGSPIWFEHRDDRIYIHVDGSSRKARNVAGNPNVSLTLDTRTPPYKGAVLRGTVRVLPPDPDMHRRVAHRYLGSDMGDAYVEMTEEGFADSVLLEMTVSSRHTWDYGKALL